MIISTLTGSIPAFSSVQSNLDEILIYDNRLSGGLTDFFSVPPTRLAQVDFENNWLSGRIPDSIDWHTHVTSLEYLILANNVLTGALPTTQRLLTSTETFFQFYLNRLTGNVPTQFGRLTRVREIAGGANTLSSRIPSELGLLSNPSSLFLGSNRLTGTVPPELASLPALELLFLQGNNFLDRRLELLICQKGPVRWAENGLCG